MAETEGASAADRLLITRTTAEDGTCVVTLVGEADLDSSARLRETLLSCLTAAPATVADLGGLTFMDSSGINALISAHQAAQASGVRLSLAAPREAVLRVLELVGLDTLIPWYPTVEAALAA
ncbi:MULTISPECIES: STAS domain-containing protein [unclassified Streptomyces]|uniref:STAS domain-containing protein n=1 Tax=unclassified Streptomyces TaxID=2593676 RepID=UPI000369ED8B|nr:MULTISPECIES: STAS domain-containing protein [unclassified Streptomyces]